MDKVRSILETLSQQEGVNLAMIVSRDGFIIDLQTARELPADPEIIAASVSSLWGAGDVLGHQLAAERGVNTLIEFRGALVSTTVLDREDLLLAVVSDQQSNPATMRYLTAKFSELLARAF